MGPRRKMACNKFLCVCVCVSPFFLCIPMVYDGASLVAQRLKCLPIQETQVCSLVLGTKPMHSTTTEPICCNC